jgi:hypothetical protein
MASYAEVVKGCRKRLFSEPCEPGEVAGAEKGTATVEKVVKEKREETRLGHCVLVLAESEKRKQRKEKKREKAEKAKKAKKAKKARCVGVVLEPV